MSSRKITIFSRDISDCPCWERLLTTEFEVDSVGVEAQFIKRGQQENIDAAIICLCSSPENEIDTLVRLESLSGAVPVLACSQQISLNFIRSAALKGVNRFLLCGMEKEEVQQIILEAIMHGGLREFLQTHYGNRLLFSPHIRKLLEEITYLFPHRPSAGEMAERLGISRSWLHRVCQQVFEKSFSGLIRQIWVYQALRLMKGTPLDNTDIALHLNYSEESSLARDFRKELRCSPKEARQLLGKQSPEEVMKQSLMSG